MPTPPRAAGPGPAGLDRRRRCSSTRAHRFGVAGRLQPRLQHHGRRDLVDDCRRRSARFMRAASSRLRSAVMVVQPLVVRHDVDARDRPPRGAPRSRTPRRAPPDRLPPESDSGRPHDDGRHLFAPPRLDDRAMIGGVIAASTQDRVRRSDGARGIGEREPDANRSEIDPQHVPRRPSSGSLLPCGGLVAGRAAARLRCPPVSGRRPRPRRLPSRLRRPARALAGRAIVSAAIPRSIRSLLTATAIPAFTPSGPVPASVTTPEPNARTVSCASRRSSSLPRPSRRAITGLLVASAARATAEAVASFALNHWTSSCNVRTCSDKRSILSGISFGEARTGAGRRCRSNASSASTYESVRRRRSTPRCGADSIRSSFR